jgi:sterol 3beta-glucosyltransferase
MDITLLAFGTRGDVQPAIALGKALKAEGYHVRLVASANFKSWIEAHGLEASRSEVKTR